MTEKRVKLFARLPEIYRTKDAEQSPPHQLHDYLALVEEAFSAIHLNIEELYHDLFIEFCDEWVIPYIGDLLGTSHLSGEAWTLRADVADTIALRRRKGTLGAIELLAYDLTRWGVHCVELRENLVWNQHLNHQRPDDGGAPPYRHTNASVSLRTPIRGGTVTLRDPSTLSLLGTPFDPFAHLADVRPPADGSIRYNLPNLAIFLWRLAVYRVRVTRPIKKGIVKNAASAPLASHVVRFSVNPVERPYLADDKRRAPVRLFNTNLVDITNSNARNPLNRGQLAPAISLIDETPGPVPVERLTQEFAANYVSVETYDASAPLGPDDTEPLGIELSDVGFQLHLPESEFAGEVFPRDPLQPFAWKIRGVNLCDWENGVQPPLEDGEIAIDPVLGRFIVGVRTDGRAASLEASLLVTHTYGAVGPIGAHPISRPAAPQIFNDEVTEIRIVNGHKNRHLVNALKDVHLGGRPLVIVIQDSLTHTLDLDPLNLPPDFTGEVVDDGSGPSLMLNRSLIIRAEDGQRPVIELAQSLRFRPVNVVSPTKNPKEQGEFDNAMSKLTVRLEGLYLTRGATFPPADHSDPLITRAALNSLEILDCTLDPGGYRDVEGKRAPLRPSMRLEQTYGFTDADEESAFKQIPRIILRRTMAGALFIDSVYRLDVTDSIIDAGKGTGAKTMSDLPEEFAVTSASDEANGWGPPSTVSGITVLGRTRVESIEGRGGIWVHALEVMDTQKGCIKYSYFSGEAKDRLPQNHACVKGTEARLRFTSELFGNPAYCQLSRTTDARIRERGPKDDAMGAFGFLLEAHKWRNLQIRFREFMPVGTRPLPIPVT